MYVRVHVHGEAIICAFCVHIDVCAGFPRN